MVSKTPLTDRLERLRRNAEASVVVQPPTCPPQRLHHPSCPARFTGDHTECTGCGS